MAQQLTELQERWLQALESGEYSQCKDVLHDGKGYCCLGVACAVGGVAHHYDGEFSFEGQTQLAPLSIKKNLRLLSNGGAFAGGFRLDHDDGTDLGTSCDSLVEMNDAGIPFAEIAAFIRANPEKVFLPPEAQS